MLVSPTVISQQFLLETLDYVYGRRAQRRLSQNNKLFVFPNRGKTFLNCVVQDEPTEYTVSVYHTRF